ncbi:MAG TPA: protein translocase subunit SecF [Candidatus Saccharimonadales bacterium]|nr:protein translocase subunit SecF [Candidatus Saccharimonadales bacterium]
MNIIGRRRIWYAISLLIIVPGLFSLFTHGLRLGIDFKGGQLLEVTGQVTTAQVQDSAAQLKLKDVSVISSSGNTLVRYRDDGDAKKQQQDHQVLSTILANAGHHEVRFETVGPSISGDITRNAIIAVALAAAAIVLYIAFAFRNIPPPVSSWGFGIAAIVALLHDALLLIGVFSILGWLFQVEIDSLFVTAVLTVIGFSVHDTIVVFDRIRENLRRERGSFGQIVNQSINETLARSLNTSMTVLLTLLALYLFGGETIRLFVLALLIGIASGTYSSILNAAPLLVTWQTFRSKRSK